MKRYFVYTLILLAAVSASATDYVFEANTNHVLRSDYRTTITNLPLYVVIFSKGLESEARYRVYVTEAQYNAGWDAYPQASKNAAATAGKDYWSDFDNWEGRLRATIEALYDEINVIRADPKLGLPAITKAQQKQKIKDKDPTKNKEKDK